MEQIKGATLREAMDRLNECLHIANDRIKEINGARKPNTIFLGFKACGRDCYTCPHPYWMMNKLYRKRGRAPLPTDPHMVSVEIKHPKVSPHVNRDPDLVEMVDLVIKIENHRSRIASQFKKADAVRLEAYRFAYEGIEYAKLLTASS